MEANLFRPDFTADRIQATAKGTLAEVLDIRVVSVEGRSVTATMPVDHRTHQPMGILHGGASVALAETVGSISANGTLDPEKQYAVGLEINANHLRSIRSGLVTARSLPIHIGRSTQVWEIRLTDEQDKLVCISRLTVAILNR